MIQVVINAQSDDVKVGREDIVIRDDDDTVDEAPEDRRPPARAKRGHFEFDIPANTKVVGWGRFFSN
jgi:hypothetical protein